jgi:hypothetical protein
MRALDELGIEAKIDARPNEVDPAIPFAQDDQHATYDPAAAHLFWQQLVQADRCLAEFRSHFVGKVSPVHFFWGAMDMACTRFSGREAPEHPGGAPNCGDWVMVEGYNRELSSAGFWPGGGAEGAFYSYAYPEPRGSLTIRWHPRRRTTASRTASSCCRTRQWPTRRTRTGRWRSSSTAPTRRPPTGRVGPGEPGGRPGQVAAARARATCRAPDRPSKAADDLRT